MSLTKEQLWQAWESWRMQEADRLAESLRTCEPDDGPPEPIKDLLLRMTIRIQEGQVPASYVIASSIRLAYDFGRYLANLEREEESLTVDEHDGTVLNIIPYAGEGADRDNRPQS